MLTLLTGNRRENRVEIGQELLVDSDGSGSFKNIIEDETWAYGYDGETDNIVASYMRVCGGGGSRSTTQRN